MSAVGTATRRERRRYTFDLVTHLVAREFRLRYRRAVLGWLWAIAVPLARLLVLSFVFTRIVPLDIENYPAFLFTGLIAWAWFAGAVTAATSSTVDRRDLLFRPGVPRAAIPVVTALADGIDFATALPVLAVFLVLEGGIPVTALALPAVVAVQLLLVLGIGFALSSANVYVRDARLLVGVALLLGFYLTPVFYSSDQIPSEFGWLVSLNPMARLLIAYRAILVEGQLPALGPFLGLTVACAAVFAVGYAIYRAASPYFVDEL